MPIELEKLRAAGKVETVGDIIEQTPPAKNALAKAASKPVAKAAAKTQAAVVSESASLMQAIINISQSGNINIDVIDRLERLYRDTEAQRAKMAFIEALAEMQPKLPVISQRGRIIMKEKDAQGRRNGAVIQDTPFAKYEDIIEEIQPIMAEHGFSLSFTPGIGTDGKVIVEAILGHRGGHEKVASLPLPHDSSGSKNAIQAIVSSTSYAKRMLTCSLLNIVSRGEDDDAATSEIDKTISDDQLVELQALADNVGADLQKFCEFAKVDSLKDILAVDFDKAKWALESKRKKGGAK